MIERLVSPKELRPSVSVLYKRDLEALESAKEAYSKGRKVLDVPSILGRYGPNNGEILLLDGNHRAIEADKRDAWLNCTIFESEEDCLNLPEEICNKITKGVLTKYGILMLFRNAYNTMEEMARSGCYSVSDIRIKDGTFFENARHRGSDFL